MTHSAEMGGGWSLEWERAGEALERESGDLGVLAPFAGGALIATIDGLGHGAQAAQAARAAAAVLEKRAADPLPELVRRCHQDLSGTRGVAMSAARFLTETGHLTWCGIGNVEVILYRSHPDAVPTRETIVLRGGVIGHQLPPLKIKTLAVAPNDLLVMVTDGIKSAFARDIDPARAPCEIARHVLSRHARGTDDALVQVVRFVCDRAGAS